MLLVHRFDDVKNYMPAKYCYCIIAGKILQPGLNGALGKRGVFPHILYNQLLGLRKPCLYNVGTKHQYATCTFGVAKSPEQ